VISRFRTSGTTRGCTLDRIAARSQGRMQVEIAGSSALGRDMYKVTINALDTTQRRQAFQAWQDVRRVALEDPARGSARVRGAGGAIKVPIFIQGGIHGNEYEGVDAIMQLIERLATTPDGADPDVERIRDNAVVIFNVIQNPTAGSPARGRTATASTSTATSSRSRSRRRSRRSGS